eukprot:TRINITY_DN76283_c0_g1_i1.p1 TRINITY_DN76283_c0_g1~~TRINITY_DN76283_c0_g1_i1.p1  ORF type:complete len:323 (-),score=62.22 TRINITY_DN76283_c0_g1_i1:124-1092(-)
MAASAALTSSLARLQKTSRAFDVLRHRALQPRRLRAVHQPVVHCRAAWVTSLASAPSLQGVLSSGGSSSSGEPKATADILATCFGNESGGGKLTRRYSDDDIQSWRATFRFPRRQHSLAHFGYTDDELLEWRQPFDELRDADEGEWVSFEAFERFVTSKYIDVVSEEELSAKVRHFWNEFDRDGSGFIDFGEFIGVGLSFDVDWAKEKIRQDGVEATFQKYSDNGVMAEPHVFQLMTDFNFFVATATDVQTIVAEADQDGDGLINLDDFAAWVRQQDAGCMEPTTRSPLAQDADLTPATSLKRRRGGGRGRAVPLPPPEPEF